MRSECDSLAFHVYYNFSISLMYLINLITHTMGAVQCNAMQLAIS